MKPGTKSVLILFATLLIGMVIGSLVTGALNNRRLDRLVEMRSGRGMAYFLEEVVRPESPEQREQIRAVLEAAGTRFAVEMEGSRDRMRQLADSVRAALGAVADLLRQSDRQMLGPLERSRGKIVDELDKLRQKIRNSRQNRQGTGLRQIRRLCANLQPRGRPQERMLGPLPFLVSHGHDLIDGLLEVADPFAVQHGVYEL